MAFTVKEETSIREMILKFEKEKAIAELHAQATVEMKPYLDAEQKSRLDMILFTRPIQEKLSADILAVRAAKTITEIP